MPAGDPTIELHDLQALRAAGVLPAGRYISALGAVRDEAFWTRWGMRALLALGAAQLLAGIVFFFAYNWSDLSDIAKFALVEGALAIAALGAVAVGLDRAFGRVLLLAASVLTGVLLAVIGQVYQTGADVFELFVAWAALILPWVVISRSAAHWLLWLVVAQIALWLYCEQVPMAIGEMTWEQVSVISGATIAAALAAREWAVRAGVAWLAYRWTRLIPLLACLTILFLPAAGYVLDFDARGTSPLNVAAFLLAAIAAGFVYWRVLPDFAALVVAIGLADALFICLGFRLIEEAIGFSLDEVGPGLSSLAAMIAWAIAGTGAAAKAMRRLHLELRTAAA